MLASTSAAVSDGFFGGTVGAVAVAPSDPAVVYAGTGEETVRGNVSPGAGMWKSTDAGKTWTHIGLDDSYQIGRIRVHPTNPDLVYVAAMGHAFGPNDMRGVYRSRDGGRTWDRILFINRDSGAVDLAMDPTNPRILYASTWRFRRGPYFFESGGEGSALWKSTDGGDTWHELSRNKGMPKGTLGIIGVSVSPSNPQNVYSIVSEGGRRLPLARRRRDVDEDQRSLRLAPARVVLHTYLRGPEGRGHRLRRQRSIPQIERWRENLEPDCHAARGQSRSLDRPEQSDAHDRMQRRRRTGHH